MSGTLQLTSEQEDIRAVARQFLETVSTSEALRAAIALPAGFDEGVWNQIVELGWTAMSIDEEHGGLGFGQIERCMILEEMGRVLLASPFLSSAVLATDAVALAARPDAQAELLPKLAEGEVRMTLVAAGDLWGGEDLAGAVRAVDAEGTATLEGHGGLVIDAGSADALVVVARNGADEIGLYAAEAGAPGLEVEEAPQTDETRRVSRVRFAGTPARRLDGGTGTAEAIELALTRGAVAIAAEMAGAAQRCVDMSIEYAKERHQFGVPIGSFQVIKHRCADMAIEVDAAREAVLLAADILTDGRPEDARVAASTAKCAAGEAFLQAVASTVQIHGGIGFTWEHDAHLFFKRARASDFTLGSAGHQRERIATHLGV